jgi:hypothetical protein
MRLSIREFAHHLGVSDRMVSKWEAGSIPRPVNQAALDTALTRADHDIQARFACWPTRSGTAGAHMMNDSHWIIQLPVTAPNLAAALTLAEAAATGVGHLPNVMTHATTVTPPGRPLQRFPIFCDRQLPDGQHCQGRYGHIDTCAAACNSPVAP